MIESLGANVQSAVSHNTNYLVCGENVGSKPEKARLVHIEILMPNLFFSMAQDAQKEMAQSAEATDHPTRAGRSA